MNGSVDQGCEGLVVLEEFFLVCELGAWIGVWYGSKSSGVDIASMTLGGHELGVVCVTINLYKGGDFSSFSFIGD